MNTKKAEQVLNRFIDFYRDVRRTSDYRGSQEDIKEGEQAQFFYKVEKYKEKLINKYKPKKDDWYTYFIISASAERKFRNVS